MSSRASNTDYLALKDEGNALYAAGDFPGAICKYSKGLEFCANSKADLAVLLKNRAAAYLKLGDYQKVVDDTTAVLDVTPSDTVALYHRCQAYEQLGKYSEAFEDARAVNHINPENDAIQPYLIRLQKLVEDFNDSSCINALPVELILKIFGYLNHNQLAQIAKICKKWNLLVKSPVLWRKVKVRLSSYLPCQTTVTKSFIDGLPPGVTDLRLDFKKRNEWTASLDFAGISVRLQNRFPNLKMLMLSRAKIPGSLPFIIDLCTQFLQPLRVLVLFFCEFCDCLERDELGGTSKLEILHIEACTTSNKPLLDKPPFSRMPHLKRLRLAYANAYYSWFEDGAPFLNQLQVLDLAGSNMNSRVFHEIQKWGHNLKQLYLCGVGLKNSDLEFDNSVFPQAETFCLRYCYRVTAKGIVFLTKSCPTLKKISVSPEVAESFAKHPFVIKNKQILEIVKGIACCSLYHDADYTLNWSL